ncbi:MAG: putative peptidoglycan binding domain protein [Thermoleophilia bacterium]|nr:putative peptidoglycan binding domain protein [Thermoleophilia bacterium]
MSLNAIASTVKTNFVNAIEAVDKPTAQGGGGDAIGATGTTAAGAYMAQGAGAPGGGSLLKKMLVGGVIGAGAGFGASFLPIAWITNLGPGGWAAKGIMAAAGAAIGVVGAGIVHFIGKKKASLAMEAQAQQQAISPPTTVEPPAGDTLRMGSKGPEVLAFQKTLKLAGELPTKVTGVFDKATQNAVRRYEIKNGVQPTGLATPAIQQAVANDASLIKQNA